MAEKERYLKISRPGMGHYIGDLDMGVEELREHIEGGEPGELVAFEIVEMTEEEFEALPEFGGW